jgi:hypothetical protein
VLAKGLPSVMVAGEIRLSAGLMAATALFVKHDGSWWLDSIGPQNLDVLASRKLGRSLMP